VLIAIPLNTGDEGEDDAVGAKTRSKSKTGTSSKKGKTSKSGKDKV